MYAIEFKSEVKDGIIKIPEQYLDKVHTIVKVIVLNPEDEIDTGITRKEKKGFGILAHRANPKLWEQEEGAWERAVVSEYENN